MEVSGQLAFFRNRETGGVWPIGGAEGKPRRARSVNKV